MAESQIRFEDGATYEHYMGAWSRLAGRVFLDWLALPAGLRWIDVGCGNGAFTELLVEHFAPASIDGVDPSEGQLAFVRTQPAGQIARYQKGDAMALPFASGTFDAAVMALVIFFVPDPAKGLAEMVRVVKPGGSVIVGEPYWLQEPSEEYLEASGVAREDFGSHFSNAQTGERRGLELVHTIVSNKDDWDRYEGLQWFATAEFARTHPDDPDLKEVVERVSREKATYLRWGRDTLGWAIYLFRLRSAV